MLEAVKTVHSAKIVHCDLKPANFLLVKGRLKLIDFGISKAIQSNDTTNVVRENQIGTVNYMSPEALCESRQLPSSSEGRIKVKQPYYIDWTLVRCVEPWMHSVRDGVRPATVCSIQSAAAAAMHHR